MINKIPLYIKDKFVKCAHLMNEKDKLSKEIDEYFSNKGVDVDALRNNDAGSYVDALDYGNALDEAYLLREINENYLS